jgi:thymidylate synthase
MKQYLELLSNIMENGSDKSDRTGTGLEVSSAHKCVLI